MRVITSGARYIDIDAYAACIAYAELLNLQGIPAKAVSHSPINASVPPLLLQLEAELDRDYAPNAGDAFTVLDVSDPEVFDHVVDFDHIDEIIDHHAGFEPYWHDRGQAGIDIDFVGAACTMIFERWERAGLIEKINPVTARLLASGILDNTLNFGADISTKRDKAAYEALAKLADLPKDWPAQYFSACQETIEADIDIAIRDDSKIMDIAGWKGKVGIGQLVIWDAKKVLTNDLPAILRVMPEVHQTWYMSIISIKENKNYLICQDAQLQHFLAGLLGVQFKGNTAHTERMWLRKEIIKRALEIKGEL